jgi:hypothetical protein
VSVTVYRDPNRPAQQPFYLSWLNGFALISERRTIVIPAGEADIRFEGVAGGILPESAIVTGLPDGVVEKNQDAYLLSPASLLDRSLGRRVHIRRTSAATGEVRETEAVIRSGAQGAVVLETPDGIEALRCSGQRETIVYDQVPQGLSAKPTLSVRTRSRARVRATVTLSYLATGFDWQANYVAELSADGSRMDLFAWLTLANGDETSFARADTQAVAGRLNREYARRGRSYAAPLRLTCWPQGTTTSDLREYEAKREEIVVTGTRIMGESRAMMAPPPVPPPPPPPAMMAQQEELGDLKLYRIPEPVTVAAKSQKQVALLSHGGVPVELVYRVSAYGPGTFGATPTITARNRREDRLGIPLPAGGVAFFENYKGRRVLVGRGFMRDLAVGEDVEVGAGRSSDVQAEVKAERREEGEQEFSLTVTNAKPHPVRFEAEIANAVPVSGSALPTRDGRPLWAVTVPANSSLTLRYVLKRS